MLNEEIVKSGYANVKYQDKFSRAYKEARERKMGLWEE
jgi:endonuclease YncB( thermonuclease family)